MPKSNKKKRLNTTIETDLLKQFKILAAQEDKRLNQLLEESIRDVLAKYENNPSMPTKSPAPKHKKCERQEPDSNSLSLQGVETTLQQMAEELKQTRRAVARGPRKSSSLITALTGLVVGLILAGSFFTAKYSDLLKYKFELDARAIMLSRSEDSSAKAANVGVVRSSGLEGVEAMKPEDTTEALIASSVKTTLPTTRTSSNEDFAPLAKNHSRTGSSIASLFEVFDSKLSAIAWDQDPDQRLTVLGDRILHEGDAVGAATVLRINPDHVVFSSRDEVFTKKINSDK